MTETSVEMAAAARAATEMAVAEMAVAKTAVTKTAVVSETPWLFEPFWSWGPTVIQF